MTYTSSSTHALWGKLLAKYIIAFDRTLPNLLGCLLSCRFPVHASESWPVFFRSMVTFSAPFWMTSQFRCAKHSASCFVVCRTCWKVQALFKPFVGCIYKLQVKVMTFRDDVPFHFPFTAHRLWMSASPIYFRIIPDFLFAFFNRPLDLRIRPNFLAPTAYLWTSFPGSLILTPGASEERPWKGLVTCLPESGRWQFIQ